MAQLIKETITTQEIGSNQTHVAQETNTVTNSQTSEYLVYFLFGVLETLLAFRIVLKIAGASMASAFVGLIYGLTGIFILPFEGIFRRAFNQGIETTSVLEPSALVAIVVYAVIALGVVRLIRVLSGEKQVSN